VYFYLFVYCTSTLSPLSIDSTTDDKGSMADDDYDPNQDDDVASDHLDDEAPGPSKRKTTAGGGKGDVSHTTSNAKQTTDKNRREGQHGKEHIKQHGTWSKKMRRVEFNIR